MCVPTHYHEETMSFMVRAPGNIILLNLNFLVSINVLHSSEKESRKESQSIILKRHAMSRACARIV
ncbi:unnamed protein product [Amoebophrya sp. A25]|nr:unnamed protein product [Amoebophrya sp. A25]|eukprot:GSA25T00023762001.1